MEKGGDVHGIGQITVMSVKFSEMEQMATAPKPHIGGDPWFLGGEETPKTASAAARSNRQLCRGISYSGHK